MEDFLGIYHLEFMGEDRTSCILKEKSERI